MIYCESPTLEQWRAPPQENLSRPTWTKLLASGVMLSNSIEFADWRASPVQPIVCETCWNAGCAGTGLAHIVRLADHLLWLPSPPRDIDVIRRDVITDTNFIREPVLMPIAAWEGLRASIPNLPPAQVYPMAARRDVATAWIHEMPEPVRAEELRGLPATLRSALASDPIDLVPAIEVIQRLADWVHQQPEQPFEGRLRRSQDSERATNTFYFDGPPFLEWPAFVVGWDISFVLGAEHILLVGGIDAE